MKTKTFLFTVVALFLLIGGAGCDKNNDDDEICAFNVDDPINDLQWLKNKIPTTTSSDHTFFYYLYQNKKQTNKYYFVEVYGNSTVLAYGRSTVYNCKGNTLMMKGIEGPTPEGWDKFFNENTLVKQIWPNE